MKQITKLCIILLICILTLCGCSNSSQTKDDGNGSNTERLSTKTSVPKKEVEVSSFTTNILDQTPNRVDNISLTCSKINEIVVKPGETFSFCDLVGEVNSSTGYKEADVLDAQGKPFKGFGGGNCQVSSTLYNAVLQITNVEIIERHSHSKKVYYVETDKDAAVDSASKLDFKFKNNTGNDIKIYASSTDKEVTVKINQFK